MNREQLVADVLRWIASMPLLTDAAIGRLADVDTTDARWARRELERRGWTDWIAPQSAGSHPRHLAYIRDQAAPALAERCGLPVQRLGRHVPVGPAAVLRRLARLESVLAVNEAVSLLATDLRAAGGLLSDAVSFPLRTNGTPGRWWPLEAMAWLEIEIEGERYVTFLAWDRAGATDAARGARARAWRAPAATAIERPAGLLVVCADDRQRRTWDRLLTRDRPDDRERRPVALSTVSEVVRFGLLDAPWRTPGHDEHGLLDGMIADRPGSGARYRRRIGDGRVVDVPRAGAPLRVMLRRAAPGRAGLSAQVAALACALDPQERLLLEWVGRHLWLTATQLAVLLDSEEGVVSRRLDRLVRSGAVQRVALSELAEPASVTTPLGQRYLATAEHDQPRRQQRLGAIVVPGIDEAAPDGVARPRILAHELGVNAAVVALAAGARRGGGYLAEWRNVAESACAFDFHGRPSWIRPDASGVVVSASGETPFLLEYDRGSLDAGELMKKFVGYERYYSVGAWEEDFAGEPVLILVCSDYRSIRHVTRVAAEVASVPTIIVPESGAWWTRGGREAVRSGAGAATVAPAASAPRWAGVP